MRQKSNFRKNEIFYYIISYKTDNDGLSPTYREICAEFDIKSTSTVRYYLKLLEEEGRITFGYRKRGIKVKGGRWIYE